MTVDIDGPLCGDGQPGHAEAIGSGTAIARMGRELLAQGRSPALAARTRGNPSEVGAALVAELARGGDMECIGIMERAYRAVGAMCASLVNLLNPEVIVLGGSIAEHQPRLHEVVREEIGRRAFPMPAGRVRVVPPHFGGDVSLVGVVPLIAERLHDPTFRRPQATAPAIPGQT